MTDDSQRPWGHYVVLSDEADHKVKQIVVQPGRRLSLQRHGKRSEHWFVVSGKGFVSLDGSDVRVSPGVAVDVPVGTPEELVPATSDRPGRRRTG